MCEDAEIVTDTLLDGRLRLRQTTRGHRAGTDAVLLAAAADPGREEAMVDVGAGVGTVGLALALREPTLRGALLEREAPLSALARENCALNACDARLRVVTADLFDGRARREAGLSNEQASLVVTNPPFFTSRAMRPPVDEAKARAYRLDDDSARNHGAWLEASAALLAPAGRLCMIHRPEALAELLAACEGRIGAIAIRPVQGRADRPAIRILLSGRKGSRAPLRLLPSLVLHGADGRFTALADALHRGRGVIAMAE